jgi:hypothetical protein
MMAGTSSNDGGMMIGMVLRHLLFVSVRVYEDLGAAFLPTAPLGIGLRRGTLRGGCSGRRRRGRQRGWRQRADDIRILTAASRLFDGPRWGRALGRDRSGG